MPRYEDFGDGNGTVPLTSIQNAYDGEHGPVRIGCSVGSRTRVNVDADGDVQLRPRQFELERHCAALIQELEPDLGKGEAGLLGARRYVRALPVARLRPTYVRAEDRNSRGAPDPERTLAEFRYWARVVESYKSEQKQRIIGGAEEDRTPDLRIANATLSQLSYGPLSDEV